MKKNEKNIEMYSQLSEVKKETAVLPVCDEAEPQDYKKLILIVENTEDIAHFLSCILEKYGDTDIACNGQQALIKSALNCYDLIVSDIYMPVMDGIEFYKAAAEFNPEIKSRFLFFTSSFEKQHMSFFIEHNAAFLRKPSTIEEIETAVSIILNRSYKRPIRSRRQ